MSALVPHEVNYLDRLARDLKSKPPAALSCTDLVAALRYAAQLEDRGVTRTAIIAANRVYARRLDELGPDEFDRLTLLGQ